ncbi:MAG: GTPase HflX [Succinivibrio sp.]|nr:GTPase HflX [Succinivibrio sp.]
MSVDRAEQLGRAVLVQLELPDDDSREDQEELRRLAVSAQAEVVGSVVCKREVPDPRYYIGSGKVEELAALVEETAAQSVIFNNHLSPAQERSLEQACHVRVLDRTALILLIFAQRARSYEGKLQVELARLRYEQARLVRGWTHLERQKGGFGLRGGPGETQIELDRRALRERIFDLQGQLETVEQRRRQNRQLRHKNAVPTVCFVGYTNAGKSTLFNVLTSAQVYAADQLFATLDPTLRTLDLPKVGRTVFADTVGFIRHLPHYLVAAFHSTLEETASADLLLHIIDAADPRREENIAAVQDVLMQVGAAQVPQLEIFNKSDLVTDSARGVVTDEFGRPRRVYVSALRQEGLTELLAAVSTLLCEDAMECEVVLPHTQGALRSLLYSNCAVQQERFDEQGRSVLSLSMRQVDFKRLNKQCSGELERLIFGK